MKEDIEYSDEVKKVAAQYIATEFSNQIEDGVNLILNSLLDVMKDMAKEEEKKRRGE